MDEDDLKWVKNVKNILLFVKQFHENLCSKTTRFQEINPESEKRNDALMHREDLNPFNPEFTIIIFIHYKPRIAVAILDL